MMILALLRQQAAKIGRHPFRVGRALALLLAASSLMWMLAGCGASSPASAVGATSTPPTLAETTPTPPPTSTTATPLLAATSTPLPILTIVATPSPAPSAQPAAATIAATPLVAAVPSGPVPTGRGLFPLPIRVRIPKINVDALVETVGLGANGMMETPHGPDQAAWYGLGPAPGEAGASVIAGHVDSVHGPAVFWYLQELQPGDVINVDVVGGATRRFVVERSAWYPQDTAPLPVIFEAGGASRLNLITCGGVFNRALHAYDRRLVVFARLETLTGVTSDLLNPFGRV